MALGRGPGQLRALAVRHRRRHPAQQADPSGDRRSLPAVGRPAGAANPGLRRPRSRRSRGRSGRSHGDGDAGRRRRHARGDDPAAVDRLRGRRTRRDRPAQPGDGAPPPAHATGWPRRWWTPPHGAPARATWCDPPIPAIWRCAAPTTAASVARLLVAAPGQPALEPARGVREELGDLAGDRDDFPFLPQKDVDAAFSTTGEDDWRWGHATVRRLGDVVLDVLKRAVWLRAPDRSRPEHDRPAAGQRAPDPAPACGTRARALDAYWRTCRLPGSERRAGRRPRQSSPSFGRQLTDSPAAGAPSRPAHGPHAPRPGPGTGAVPGRRRSHGAQHRLRRPLGRRSRRRRAAPAHGAREPSRARGSHDPRRPPEHAAARSGARGLHAASATPPSRRSSWCRSVPCRRTSSPGYDCTTSGPSTDSPGERTTGCAAGSTARSNWSRCSWRPNGSDSCTAADWRAALDALRKVAVGPATGTHFAELTRRVAGQGERPGARS